MTITVNGDSRELPDSSSVSDLLALLGMHEIRLAVERNRAVVPSSRFDEITLCEGDSIEIVTLVGGG